MISNGYAIKISFMTNIMKHVHYDKYYQPVADPAGKMR
jgi:hypothetical protein